MRWVCAVLLVTAMVEPVSAQTTNAAPPPYKDAALPIDRRVADLLGRMTLDEKVGQLACPLGWPMYAKRPDGSVAVSDKFKQIVTSRCPGALWGLQRADPWTKVTLSGGLSPAQAAEAANAIQRYAIEHSRLGIPLLLAEECPHGHMAIGATVFPTAIGQASTWNPELIGRMARAIAAETRGCGGNVGYGPVLDLAREPRWSRVEETYGEDPLLVASMGEAMVRGFQGDRLSDAHSILSTLKHFAAHGIPEGGHNAGVANVGPRELRSALLPPFEAAVRAGAGSVMSAYNEIDGVPCSSDHWLLTDLLRDEWGFDGFVVSDLYAINGLQSGQHVARNLDDAAAMAINAGVDLDLGASAFTGPLLTAIKSGHVSEATLDRAVGRVLRAKFRLGLFDKPYVDPTATKLVNGDEHRRLAREVARQSIILLKNANDTLPLKKDLDSIAVIGPNADSVYNQLGDYTAPQPEGKVVTVLEGIRRAVGKGTVVRYAKGCGIRNPSTDGFAEALDAAKQSSAIVIVLGGSSARDFNTLFEGTGAAKPQAAMDASGAEMEAGEGFDRATLDLAGVQMDLLKQVVALGKPTVLVQIAGRPLNLNWAAEHVPAILCAWYPGEQGGAAVADALFGDANPAGRLPISVPRSVGQLPVYYNHKPDARRDYLDETAQPLYPFGFGLSFTHFDYANVQATVSDTTDANLQVTVTASVTNTGPRDGEEVVQCYLHDEISSVTRPVWSLAAFRRVALKAGETSAVTFALPARALALWDRQMRHVVEPGAFRVGVGSSSADARHEARFEIKREVSIENRERKDKAIPSP